MSNPWDLPPIPIEGDHVDGPIYEGVGRALSNWEKLELQLARLYSWFETKNRFDQEAIGRYGKPPNFRARLSALERSGEGHSRLYPDQNIEAEFFKLRCCVEKFAARRNDIAHGIVLALPWMGVNFSLPLTFALFPPDFKHTKYAPGKLPTYALVSADLLRFSAAFHDLGARSARLLHQLERTRGAWR